MSSPTLQTAATWAGMGTPPRWATWPTDRLPARHDADRLSTFAGTYMITPHGFRAGGPVILTPEQFWCLAWATERDAGGRRICQRALLGFPRKQGKSLLGAVMNLYELATSPLPAEVYSAAGSKDQASLILNESKRILEVSPRLRDEGGLRAYQYAIRSGVGSVYRVLSADARLAQGLNVSVAIADELHVWPNAELYDALTLAGSARPESLVLSVTTAGYDLSTICGRVFTDLTEISAGHRDVAGFGGAWWSAFDDQATNTDEAAWDEANPNLAHGLQNRDAIALAAATQPRHVFARYHLNLWTQPEEAWVEHETWAAAADPDGELTEGGSVFASIRFGAMFRDAAVVVAQPTGELEADLEVYRLEAFLFDSPPAGVVDFAAIRQMLGELRDTYRVRSLSYDPANATQLADELERVGVPVIRAPYTPARAAPAAADLYRLLTQGRIRHPDSPAFTEQILTAVPRVTGEGFMLTEPPSGKPATAAKAAAMALAEALFGPPIPAIY